MIHWLRRGSVWCLLNEVPYFVLIVEFVCSQTVALIWTGPDKGLQTFLLKILEELVKTYVNYKKSCILGECVKTFALWILCLLISMHCWCLHDITIPCRNWGFIYKMHLWSDVILNSMDLIPCQKKGTHLDLALEKACVWTSCAHIPVIKLD